MTRPERIAVPLTICLLSRGIASSSAVESAPADDAYFSLDATASLGSRGTLIALRTEQPDPSGDSQTRHIETEWFRLPEHGLDPVAVRGGFSGGDGHPFRSPRFSSPTVGIYLTERDEPITVERNEDGSSYEASVPWPWAEMCDRTLIRFDLPGAGAANPNLTADVTGTIADHTLRVTLRGSGAGYSFAFDDKNHRWVRLFEPTTRATTVARTDGGKSGVARDVAPPLAEQVRATLVDQQRVGPHAHMVTVKLEDSPSHSGAGVERYYYFVQNSPDGSEMRFVTKRTLNVQPPPSQNTRGG